MPTDKERSLVRIKRKCAYYDPVSSYKALEIWSIATPIIPFPWEANVDISPYRVVEIAINTETGELVVNDPLLRYPQPNEAAIFALVAPVLYECAAFRVFIQGGDGKVYSIRSNRHEDGNKNILIRPLNASYDQEKEIKINPYVRESEDTEDEDDTSQASDEDQSVTELTDSDIHFTLHLLRTEGAIQFWSRSYSNPFEDDPEDGSWYETIIMLDTRTNEVLNVKDGIDAGPVETLRFFTPLIHYLKLNRIEIKNTIYFCDVQTNSVVYRKNGGFTENSPLRISLPKYTVDPK